MTVRYRAQAVSSNRRFVAKAPHEDYLLGIELVLNIQGRHQEAGSCQPTVAPRTAHGSRQIPFLVRLDDALQDDVPLRREGS